MYTQRKKGAENHHVIETYKFIILHRDVNKKERASQVNRSGKNPRSRSTTIGPISHIENPSPKEFRLAILNRVLKTFDQDTILFPVISNTRPNFVLIMEDMLLTPVVPTGGPCFIPPQGGIQLHRLKRPALLNREIVGSIL